MYYNMGGKSQARRVYMIVIKIVCGAVAGVIGGFILQNLGINDFNVLIPAVSAGAAVASALT
jgi:hypothetical protein